jgi:hypothetical protein
VSDRPAGRPVPHATRASARKGADTDDGTNDGTSTQRSQEARGGDAKAPLLDTGPDAKMSNEEREKVRHAGAEDARRSRAQQGLPERIEDPAAIATLAAILRDTSTPPAT